jgi:hypothetical protein
MSKLGQIIGGAIAVSALAGTAVTPAVARDGGEYRTDWRGGNPHRAVDLCRRSAEREASRQAWGRADVTDIRDVRETRGGYEVRGRITVNSHREPSRSHWNRSAWRYRDDGSFKCRVEYGRIAYLDINGIRGM